MLTALTKLYMSSVPSRYSAPAVRETDSRNEGPQMGHPSSLEACRQAERPPNLPAARCRQGPRPVRRL